MAGRIKKKKKTEDLSVTGKSEKKDDSPYFLYGVSGN